MTEVDHTASLEEAQAARLPLGYRDACSAYVGPSDPSLLIPLNQCRRKTLYAPWKCEEERYVGTPLTQPHLRALPIPGVGCTNH